MWNANKLLAFLFVIAAGCGAEILGPDGVPPELRAPPLSVASWEQVVREEFSYALPPGFEATGATPIDSDAATWVRGDDSLQHDFGRYSGPWTASRNEDMTEVSVLWARLGGRSAQLVSYRIADRYVVRAWWESVVQSELGDLHLVVLGESDTSAGRDELLSVIRSVRFH